MSQDSDGNEMIMSLRDWRQAIRTPTAYRVGNSTLRIQTQFVSIIAIIGLILLFVLYTFSPPYRHRTVNLPYNGDPVGHILQPSVRNLSPPVTVQQDYYNATYPLTPPVKTPKGVNYRIGVISDMDKSSKSREEENTWISYYQKGYLSWNPKTRAVSVIWDSAPPVVLKSNLGEGGRGMELSELITFNGKLIAVDDRTGVVYELQNDQVIPWVLLTDGDGRTPKGFKMEWAAVKDQFLYLGGLGKEWTSGTGELLNYNPQWIKTVSPTGEVSHHNWRDKYSKLRRSFGIEFPGYMIHEAVGWSAVHKRWFFLPRRASKNKYNEELDEKMGTNIILSADDNFEDIQVTYVGEVIPTHGFSSFKFLPDTDDQVIIALRTMETKEKIATFIMAFTVTGLILMPETSIGNIKFEGFEFI
ncbi:soluble calcium-activated nucleotidase 1 [Anabrus simplex]|uniref:soluble calcium-activated nucleotidase 1 n=1 Tax=Anabrus simplex TaxID=316456 RepID=UPI0035A36B12